MWAHYFSFLRQSFFYKPTVATDAFNGSYRRVGVIKDSLRINGDAVIGSSSAEQSIVDDLVFVSGTFTSENTKFTRAVHTDGVTKISDCMLDDCFINGGFSAFNSTFSRLSLGIGSQFHLSSCHVDELIIESSALLHDREIILDSTRVHNISSSEHGDEKMSHRVNVILLNTASVTGKIDERVTISDRTSKSSPRP